MKIAIITGASSGMGLEFALQLDCILNNVDEIWLISRRKEELLRLASCMEHDTRVLDMDLTKDGDLDKFTALLETEKPNIRMLVNSAGYGIMGPFTDHPYEDEIGMIDVNCKSLTQMSYLCIPYMEKHARIIQMASSAGFLPQPKFAVYAATKSYALSFSRALRVELAPQNIYVTAVCPGPVKTPFFDVAQKNGQNTLLIKKLFYAKPEKVVNKAIADSLAKKELSVYGISIQLFHVIAKMIPHSLFMKFFKFLK